MNICFINSFKKKTLCARAARRALARSYNKIWALYTFLFTINQYTSLKIYSEQFVSTLHHENQTDDKFSSILIVF